eukprot:CAMPEP_0169126124 /NCGR_PEP_ID=MMETSP1015-20121227/35273_1 /TAXON_ID=342587 /ORGANISM="Karlodinium micrum, Strain CCMP2283" /LENGTH=139 /DNA_ID=CAMNT_0009189751 /DNA_START=39 /DNA_END=458 /DNA_ORIENTATION=+
MASQPTVGSRVLARGSPGEVVLYDPDDPSMMYKVSLDGGNLDWFKQDEVCIDGSVATTSEDAEEIKRKTERAAAEMAALKAKREEYAKEGAQIKEKAMKALEEDKKLIGTGKEKLYTSAEPPTKPETVSNAIAEDNDVY